MSELDYLGALNVHGLLRDEFTSTSSEASYAFNIIYAIIVCIQESREWQCRFRFWQTSRYYIVQEDDARQRVRPYYRHVRVG